MKYRLSDLMVEIPKGEIVLRDDRTKKKLTGPIDSFYMSSTIELFDRGKVHVVKLA